MPNKEKREFAAWWLWVLLLLVISIPVLFALNSFGLMGKTVVKRIVFEQSYQRKAGDDAKMSIFKAQRASLKRQLQRSDITSAQRSNFEAQLSAVEIQIFSTK